MSRGTTVSVQNVHKAYGPTRALDGLSLFAHGGVTTLLGPNGAGKTTLLKGLATVHRFDGGLVQLDGMSPGTLRRLPEQLGEGRRRNHGPAQHLVVGDPGLPLQIPGDLSGRLRC